MKITITIEDHENGRVKVDSTPHMTVLAKMARARDITPAGGYALGALAKIIKDSQNQVMDTVQERFNRGEIPAIQSKRRMFN